MPTYASPRRPALAAAAVGLALLAGAVGQALARETPEPAPATVLATPGPPERLPQPPPGDRPTLVVPPGAIDLSNATIELPPLPGSVPACEGTRTFAGAVARGSAPGDPAAEATLRIEAEWSGRLDGRPQPDTFALVTCDIVDAAHNWQLVAVTGPAGGARTLGQVLASGAAPAPAVLFGLTFADGAVLADLGDFVGDGDANAARISAHQTRGYRWSGGTFRQVFGPTSFGPNPNFYDLAVTAGSLALTGPANGPRAGTLTVTVRNAGPAAAREVSLTLSLPSVAEPVGGSPTCDGTENEATTRILVCSLGTVEAGQERVITFGFRAEANPAPAPALPAFAQIAGLDHLGLGYALDPHDTNDTAPIPISLPRSA